jgi:hypothetical protein
LIITAFTSTHRLGFMGNCVPKIQQFQQDGDPYLEYIFRLQLFTLLPAPNSNAIYLGMFDLYSHSYQSIFLFFGIFKN